MSLANVWLAMSTQARDEFRARRQQGDEFRARRQQGDEYSGPMDDETYYVLDKMSDQEVVSGLFATPTLGGKTYITFSVYLPGEARVQKAIDDLTERWPGHFIVVGAWFMDGRQAGTQWELDEEGERTGNVTGTPIYPIPAQAYRIMPPVIVYGPDREVISSTAATSNADLRDINLLASQAPRRFT